jgi:hypothetical protein
MAQPEKLYQASNKFQRTNQVPGIKALRDHIIVRDMDFSGRKLASGILLLNDDGKTDGIRPRWAKVYAVGPEHKDVKVGQWIMLEHGRWTRGLKVEIDGEEIVVRRADTKAIIFVSNEEPKDDDTMSTAVDAQKLSLPGQ